MPENGIENFIDEIAEDSAKDAAKTPEVRFLETLLERVRVNRRAMEIVKALESDQRQKAMDIVAEANRAGISPERLKIACRAMRGSL